MLKRIINYLKSNQIDCHANKSAFTLAETLIVMGIIGVVAALTLPNLNSSTGDKEKVVKLKKIYSNLEDAFGRAKAFMVLLMNGIMFLQVLIKIGLKKLQNDLLIL